MKSKKLSNYLSASNLFLITFCTGLINMSSEALIGSVSTYISGNGIVEMTRSMGITFLGMFCGTMLYHILESKGIHINSKQARKLFIYNELILGTILGITPHALFTVFSIFPGYYEIFQLILTILNGAFTAFEVPLTTSMNAKFMEKMPDNLTFILSADYLGGAVGTFFWIDFILKYVPLHYAGFVLAGINYLICIVAFLGSPKEDKLNFKDFQFFIGFAISLLITIALNSDKIITFTENIRGI